MITEADAEITRLMAELASVNTDQQQDTDLLALADKHGIVYSKTGEIK